MPEEAGSWTVLEAIERFGSYGREALEEVLGPFVLVAHANEDGAPVEGWSFRTVAMKPTKSEKPISDMGDLRRTMVYAVRKRTARFPGTILVGRALSNDICIDSKDVSKLHTRIRVASDGLYVDDAGSRNGTFVEGERIGRESKVNQGESLRFGTYAVTVYSLQGFQAHLRRLAAASSKP